MKKIFFTVIVLIFGIGLFFASNKENIDTSPIRDTEEQAQENKTEKITKQSGEIPPMLNLEFPAEIPTPYNPCYSLQVPESIKQNRAQLKDEIEKAKVRGKNILGTNELPKEVHRGSSEEKLVALTIDTGTGGREGVKEILEIARHYNINLTFFLTGCWVLENPELTQTILAEGHSIGNHSLTHLNLASASDDSAEREIGETDRILEEVVGFKPVLFRKPQYAGGERITKLVGEYGMISVQGYPDLGDTGGWRSDSSPEDVSNLIERKTEPGAIWVLHNLSLSDLKAFERVVRFHLENGYRLVRVEDILVN